MYAPKRVVTRDLALNVWKMLNAGQSPVDIYRDLGVSDRTVQRLRTAQSKFEADRPRGEISRATGWTLNNISELSDYWKEFQRTRGCNEKGQLIVKGIAGTSDNNVLRPIPEEWPHGSLSGTKETLRGPAAKRWSTDRPQQVGDDFALNLGQELPLKTIRFLQGTGHQWDHPKRWKMTFSNSRQIIEEVDGNGFIEVERKDPTPVQLIGVIIVEPRLPTDHPPAICWAVDNIVLE